MDGDQESSTSSQAKFPLFLVPAKYIIHPTPRLFFSFHDYQFPPLSTLSCRFHDLHEMVGRLLLATQQSPVFHHVFSAKPNQLARVCTSLTDAFSSAADTCPFHVLPLDPFALLPPPSFPPSPANYASSRKKESGYYTRVLLVNSLFPPRDPICEECPRNSQSYVQISTFLAGNHILSPWSTIVGVRRGRGRGGRGGIIKLHYQQQILFSFYFLYIICFFDDRAKV